MADADPVRLFRAWQDEARKASVLGADTMVLATADGGGRPSARAVILRGVDERGFLFYTDVGSHKARDLAENPRAALVFLWPERQVRVEGDVVRVPDEEADADFAERPRAHRIATWAARQTEPIEGPAELERGMAEAERRYPDDHVPRPPYWGGYRVRPAVLEFWQGRPDRLHQRVRYRRVGERWVGQPLAP